MQGFATLFPLASLLHTSFDIRKLCQRPILVALMVSSESRMNTASNVGCAIQVSNVHILFCFAQCLHLEARIHIMVATPWLYSLVFVLYLSASISQLSYSTSNILLYCQNKLFSSKYMYFSHEIYSVLEPRVISISFGHPLYRIIGQFLG